MPRISPLGMYFVRTPNGPGGPEYHIHLEDDRWKGSDDMVAFINDAYPQPGFPTTGFPGTATPTTPYHAFATGAAGGIPGDPSHFHPFFAGTEVTTFLNSGLNPGHPYPLGGLEPNWTSFYKISRCKKIGYFPMGSLALNKKPFEKITYKSVSTGFPPKPFKGRPLLNIRNPVDTDPLSQADFPIFNALDRDTLFDDDGNEYFPDTFWQKKGNPPQAWIYQELRDSNLPVGDGDAKWRWVAAFYENQPATGPVTWTKTVLSSGSFINVGGFAIPTGGYSNVQNNRLIDPSLSTTNTCEYWIRLEYSPDGTHWPIGNTMMFPHVGFTNPPFDGT